MSDSSAGVRVDGRVIPFPDSVSPEAKANLQRLVNADGVPFNALYRLPAPEDREAWIALKVTADAHYAKALSGLAGSQASEVETIELGETIIHIATPKALSSPDRAYIELHGGGLVFGGGEACRIGARMQADLHGVRCYSVDYRMPPEHPYPAALDDCLATYRAVLERYAPENIIIGGRSAGGNLAAATVLRARDEGLPLPAALVLLSPQLDLTESGDSFEVNRMVDVVLPGSLMPNHLLYAAGKDLKHPYLSPLFGDVSRGFPPTFLLTGTRDLFLSTTVRMHRQLRRAAVPVELHVFEAMPHGGFMGAPEDREAAQEVARFVREHWAIPPVATAKP